MALYADANHVAPKGIFFTVMSVVILLTRPLSGRAADRLGYKKILFPSLTLIALGLALLAASGTRPGLVGLGARVRQRLRAPPIPPSPPTS